MEHLMTAEELYQFAMAHNCEKSPIWIPTGTNTHHSVNSARVTIESNVDDPAQRKIYLVYNS